MASPLLTWLREHTSGWSPSIVGVFREQVDHEWPLVANSPAELRRELTDKGHLLPLPSESASLANVMEIELRQHLMAAAAALPDVAVNEGTARSYPDLEVFGPAFGGGDHRAVDIKCARRKIPKKGDPTKLNNRIALYTGNTYFLWPTLKFAGILRPFADYAEHISIVVIYTFDADAPERILDVDVAVHETWRLGSTKRASSTREYIGSIDTIDDIINGNGEFDTIDDFYAFWRHSTRNWKKSPEAERLLRRALGDS